MSETRAPHILSWSHLMLKEQQLPGEGLYGNSEAVTVPALLSRALKGLQFCDATWHQELAYCPPAPSHLTHTHPSSLFLPSKNQHSGPKGNLCGTESPPPPPPPRLHFFALSSEVVRVYSIRLHIHPSWCWSDSWPDHFIEPLHYSKPPTCFSAAPNTWRTSLFPCSVCVVLPNDY